MEGGQGLATGILVFGFLLLILIMKAMTTWIGKKEAVLVSAVVLLAGLAAMVAWNAIVGAVLFTGGMIVAALSGLAALMRTEFERLGGSGEDQAEYRIAKESAEAEDLANYRDAVIDRLDAIEAELAALNGRRRKAQAMHTRAGTS